MSTIDLDIWVNEEGPIHRLWGMVLLLAIKDQATSVTLDPGRGEFALTYVIDGQEFGLVPPPECITAALESLMRDTLRSYYDRFLDSLPFRASRVTGAFVAKVCSTKVKVEGWTDRSKNIVSLHLTRHPEAVADAERLLHANIRFPDFPDYTKGEKYVAEYWTRWVARHGLRL